MYRYAAPQRGRYREHWQLSVEAIGSDAPVRRRRDHPALPRAARAVRRDRVHARAELDRLPRMPARLPRAAARVARCERSTASTRRRREKASASPLRVFDNYDAKPRGGAGGARRGAEDRGVALRGLPRALRGRAPRPRRVRRLVRARSDAGARARLLHAHHLGVPRPRRGSAERALGRRALRRAGRGDRRAADSRESASARGSNGSCSRSSTQVERRLRPSTDIFFAADDGASRALIATWLGTLRARGIASDTDYARRSLKGQLTQAARVGAETVVQVRADGATRSHARAGGRGGRARRSPRQVDVVSWRDAMCGELRAGDVGTNGDAGGLGLAPTGSRRAGVRRPPRPDRADAARDQPRARGLGRRARAGDPERVRAQGHRARSSRALPRR